MNNLCCKINPFYYCGECDIHECKECWTKGKRASHFKFSPKVGGLAIFCAATGKRLISGETFLYYG